MAERIFDLDKSLFRRSHEMKKGATAMTRAVLLLTALAAAGLAFAEDATQTKHRGSYALNGRIHV